MPVALAVITWRLYWNFSNLGMEICTAPLVAWRSHAFHTFSLNRASSAPWGRQTKLAWTLHRRPIASGISTPALRTCVQAIPGLGWLRTHDLLRNVCKIIVSLLLSRFPQHVKVTLLTWRFAIIMAHVIYQLLTTACWHILAIVLLWSMTVWWRLILILNRTHILS